MKVSEAAKKNTPSLTSFQSRERENTNELFSDQKNANPEAKINQHRSRVHPGRTSLTIISPSSVFLIFLSFCLIRSDRRSHIHLAHS